MLTKEECDVGMVIMKYVIKRNRARLGSYGIDDDEAASMGLVGLAQAIKDYETQSRCTTWFKFAYQKIWQSIFQSDTTMSRRKFIIDSGIKRIRDLYFQKTGSQLTDEHLAYLLDANELFPKILRDHFRKTKTLPYTVSDDGEARGIPLADARVLPEPENTLSRKDFVEVVQSILNDENEETKILTDDERYTIKLYFGIGYPRSYTFGEIASLRCCGRAQISRHIKSSLEKLKCDSRLKELHLELVEA